MLQKLMIQLRPHQVAAVDAVEQSFREGTSRPLIDACVGAGKSLMYAELAQREIARGGRVLVCAHTRELVEQNAAACRSLGLEVGINAAALNERCWRAPVISAAIQSVYKNGIAFGPISMLCVDECFPAGTLISSPKGDVPIEQIQAGDSVFHALGCGIVEATSRRVVTELVEVRFDDGTRLVCTENHPLFTIEGWTSAGMATGCTVFRYEGVRALRQGVSPSSEIERRSMEQAAVLLNILFQERGKCHARPGGARKDGEDVARDWLRPEGSRRERVRHDQGASGAIVGARVGMGSGVSSSDMSDCRLGVPDALQNRLSESSDANRDRGGRQFSQRKAETSRSKKGRFSALVGVASVSRIELARPIVVYNLQVRGHPSYFANGFLVHNCHLVPHSESGMYRALHRALAYPRLVGGSGTVFRLQGGSLIEGKDAPFERVVYTYSILNGIRDGYLVPAYSAPALDKIDPSNLRTRQGEFTGESQDDQMLAAIDNHIAQMVHFGEDRRGWLIFEASTKAARAMAARLGEWGVPTGLVLGTTPAGERTAVVEAYRAGRLRALVNVAALTTGFDVQHVDMLVMRRRTKSLGLYIQMTGRLLRTIGGNIEASIAAGKADGVVLDFAGNIDQHGPLDFIRPKSTKPSLTACDACGTRNVSASRTCWSCGAALLKNCPACLEAIEKDQMTCPHCDYDMRTGPVEVKKSLSDRPSDSAIIAAYKSGSERVGGWLPIGQLWEHEGKVWARAGEAVNELGVDQRFRAARWLRSDPLAILVPHGSSRTIARQINIADGSELIVPLPQINVDSRS